MAIKFEISGEEDDSLVGVEGDRVGFGDGVRDSDGFNFKFTQLEFFARRHFLEFGFEITGSFFEFHAHHSLGEGRAVEGEIEFSEEVGEGTDVVFVGVGDDYSSDFVFVFEDVCEVGDDNIDAVVFFVGE